MQCLLVTSLWRGCLDWILTKDVVERFNSLLIMHNVPVRSCHQCSASHCIIFYITLFRICHEGGYGHSSGLEANLYQALKINIFWKKPQNLALFSQFYDKVVMKGPFNDNFWCSIEVCVQMRVILETSAPTHHITASHIHDLWFILSI